MSPRTSTVQDGTMDVLLLKQIAGKACKMLCREIISFGDIEVFENDDHTRTFLSLGISKGRKQVSTLIFSPVMPEPCSS